jgi:hypothetical protein
MKGIKFPNNLNGLYKQEQALREKAVTMLQSRSEFSLHLDVIERAMSLAKVVVDYPTDDEDFKVIKMLSIRMFNAFGASLELMLTGYHQNSGLIMRDILETVFLMDLFATDPTEIERWRFADEKMQREKFSPVAVRKALDRRDGCHSKKREELYKMFSKLAAHPNMHSQHMLLPEKGGDITMGPFMEVTTLQAGLGELGKLAVQTGEIMDVLLHKEWNPEEVRTSFKFIKKKWIEKFYK